LLDVVALSRSPLLVRNGAATWRLPSACDFSGAVVRSPLRYVLTDELLRLCVELAYSEGDELASCLDLVRLPAEQLWLEWRDDVKHAELARVIPDCPEWSGPRIMYKGVLVSAQAGAGGAPRRCTVRTLFTHDSDPDDALVMATEAHVDLDHRISGSPAATFLDGGTVVVSDQADASVNSVLQHVGFRLDPAWQRYYRSAALEAEAVRATVISDCLGGVAVDLPIILSLLLLLSLPTGVLQVPVARLRLNAKRARLGKAALLDHIEISCPELTTKEPTESAVSEAVARSAPRLHHVRGHLVRRGDSLYWRRAHWRGHLRLGSARSQTREPVSAHRP
jgi:hypothetical protein